MPKEPPKRPKDFIKEALKGRVKPKPKEIPPGKRHWLERLAGVLKAREAQKIKGQRAETSRIKQKLLNKPSLTKEQTEKIKDKIRRQDALRKRNAKKERKLALKGVSRERRREKKRRVKEGLKTEKLRREIAARQKVEDADFLGLAGRIKERGGLVNYKEGVLNKLSPRAILTYDSTFKHNIDYGRYTSIVNPKLEEKVLFYFFAGDDFNAVRLTNSQRFVFLDSHHARKSTPEAARKYGAETLSGMLKSRGVVNHAILQSADRKFEIYFNLDGKLRHITYYIRDITEGTPSEAEKGIDVLRFTDFWNCGKEDFDRVFSQIKPGGHIFARPEAIRHRLGEVVHVLDLKDRGGGSSKNINIYRKKP